jgi:membrane protein
VNKEAKSRSRYQTFRQTVRSRYEGSFPHELLSGLGAVNFGDRIIIFGASLLISVLPLIIVLSAYAGHHIEDDIAQHLGLSAKGDRIVEGLFKSSVSSFNLAILISLLLSLAGTVAVARSVQVIYERAYDQPPITGWRTVLRSMTWVVVTSGVVIGDDAIGERLRDEPLRAVLLGLVEFLGFALFFWWSIHFLLGARKPWRELLAGAIASAICWVGLGVFAAFYFSSTIVSDSKTYGTIGVVFTLVTWFIALGAVVTIGAVFGAVLQERRGRKKRALGAPRHGASSSRALRSAESRDQNSAAIRTDMSTRECRPPMSASPITGVLRSVGSPSYGRPVRVMIISGSARPRAVVPRS